AVHARGTASTCEVQDLEPMRDEITGPHGARAASEMLSVGCAIRTPSDATRSASGRPPSTITWVETFVATALLQHPCSGLARSKVGREARPQQGHIPAWSGNRYDEGVSARENRLCGLSRRAGLPMRSHLAPADAAGLYRWQNRTPDVSARSPA